METWPRIWAEYDDEGVWVYQAFKDEIVDAALELGRFGKGFSLDRMTWIKPSLGWMMYRSAYATNKRQTRILRIKLSREGFDTILGMAALTHFDHHAYESKDEWAQVLGESQVRCQWDPERDLRLRKTGERAIQIGLKGDVVMRYVGEWILEMEDRTELARHLGEQARRKKETEGVWSPRVYEVCAETARRLGMVDASEEEGR